MSSPTHGLAGLLALCALAPSLLSQSNAIPGLDIRAYEVTDATAYGRRGPAWPNGEVGIMIGHSYCNAGSVDMVWVDEIGGVMVDTYPRIAFLVAKEEGGRMVQVSDRSFLKHSTVPYNFSSGPCAPCRSGSGEFMFVGCSDTYSSGINSNRYYLAPADEIDPWLGAWNPVGSYFDRGDPPVTGSAATDARRSLTSAMVSTFDAVKNRIVIQESELTGSGQLYGQIYLSIQGESVTIRDNNYRNRPLSMSWNGSSWSASTTGSSAEGPVLTRWTGATTAIGGNGNSDGRFMVGVKVTGPTNGIYHYEFAVHNLDNFRGGAAFRVPLDSAAQVSNIGFRDVDTDPQNQWTVSRSSTELAFLAAANNALDWNTIYNFWFDCDVAPSFGAVLLDAARPGAGSMQIAVQSQVPSGIPSATKSVIGQGCGDCDATVYEFFSPAGAFDLANDSLTFTLASGSYSYGPGTGSWVAPAGTQLTLSDDQEVTVNLPFSLPYPGGTTNRLIVCSNGFVSPAASNGTTYTPAVGEFLNGAARWAIAWHDLNPNNGGRVMFDANQARAVLTFENIQSYSGGGLHTFQAQFLANGTVHYLWQSVNPTGNDYLVGWTPGGPSSDPGSTDLSAVSSSRGLCATRFMPLALDASDRPVLGRTIDVTTSNIPGGTVAGATLFDTSLQQPPLDLGFAGMPGCFAYLPGGIAQAFPTTMPVGGFQLTIPNDQRLIGVGLVAQSFTFGPPLTPSGWINSNGLLLQLGL
ncbi:MAG: hypothetical protein IPM29_11785 [Planctomycetes bacterium]|nr:hypothetical protein [Planctomycetota bacterium]